MKSYSIASSKKVELVAERAAYNGAVCHVILDEALFFHIEPIANLTHRLIVFNTIADHTAPVFWVYCRQISAMV